MGRLLSLLWLPVAASAVLLVAVLGYGMDVRQLLVLYWAENFIVGLWNLARIAVARPPAWTNRRPMRLWPLRFANALGFSLIYFSFNIGMGLMLGGVVSGDLQARMVGVEPMLERLWADTAALVCLAVIAVSHGVTYFVDYLGRGEYRRVTPPALRNRPFPRLLVTGVLVLFGGPLFLIADRPWLGVLAFIGVKLATEVWFTLREQGRST